VQPQMVRLELSDRGPASRRATDVPLDFIELLTRAGTPAAARGNLWAHEVSNWFEGVGGMDLIAAQRPDRRSRIVQHYYERFLNDHHEIINPNYCNARVRVQPHALLRTLRNISRRYDEWLLSRRLARQQITFLHQLLHHRGPR